jgi:hypothetical protein
MYQREAYFADTHAFSQTDEDDDDLLETEADTDVLPFKGIDAALKGEPFLAIEYASVRLSPLRTTALASLFTTSRRPFLSRPP